MKNYAFYPDNLAHQVCGENGNALGSDMTIQDFANENEGYSIVKDDMDNDILCKMGLGDEEEPGYVRFRNAQNNPYNAPAGLFLGPVPHFPH